MRWTLDVPDTWFHVERVDKPGSHGWVFRGRGWGHGVGMCQAGAFGMAVRGPSYREILEHYYTGIRARTPQAGATASAHPCRLSRAA